MSVDPKVKGVEGASGKDEKACPENVTVKGVSAVLQSTASMLITLFDMVVKGDYTPSGRQALADNFGLALSVKGVLVDYGIEESIIDFEVPLLKQKPKHRRADEIFARFKAGERMTHEDQAVLIHSIIPEIDMVLNHTVRMPDGNRISISTICSGCPTDAQSYHFESALITPGGLMTEPKRWKYSAEGLAFLLADLGATILTRYSK